jgi:uncharacterized protein
MHPALLERDHRPWPIPERPWTWRQSWLDLAFLHWPIASAKLRPLVPPSLELREFDGTSWIGVVPFRMSGVMRRPLPDVPWVSAFPELNVRLYVERDGKPGVWFLSLDAANPVAVWAARRFFHLPYHLASMSLVERDGAIRYRSRRPGAEFEATYRPTSDVYRAARGTLEHWLTERYCLYALAPDGSLWRNDVHHAPWPLQSADAQILTHTLLAPHGLEVQGPPVLTHFARRLDVVVWSAERVA